MTRKFVLLLLLPGLILFNFLPLTNAADDIFSKYSFVPGEKFLLTEDLSTTAIGEAPLSLQANGDVDTILISGERWLKMGPKAELNIPIKEKIDDLTFEFYLKASNPENNSHLTIYLENEDKEYEGWIILNSDRAEWGGNNAGEDLPRNNLEKHFYNTNQVVPVALTLQKERVKLFVNQVLVMNVAKFSPVMPNKILIQADEALEENDLVALKEIKIASVVPDIASEILTKGKYTSHGIRFDTGSAKVKDESFAVLKQVADVMTGNPDLKLLIAGHTDNVGAKEANKKLSLDRAESVKQYLVSRFGISASRLETKGDGDAEPIADNKTAEGKAKNRRVEFIKASK